MPTTIPLGFHVWSATLTVTGSTHNNVITCGGKNAGYLTAASINNAWRTAMSSTSRPLNANNIPQGWSLVEMKVLANIGGLLYTDINTSPFVGIGVATPPPMNTALIVRKDTGIAGRPYQARLFSPPAVLEASVDAAGNITSGLAAIQNWWTGAYTDLQTALIDPVVLHEPSLGLVPTKINSFTVKSRLGTIGRRMRR